MTGIWNTTPTMATMTMGIDMTKTEDRLAAWYSNFNVKNPYGYQKLSKQVPARNYHIRICDYGRGKYLDYDSESILLSWFKDNNHRGYIKKTRLNKLRLILLDLIILGGEIPNNLSRSNYSSYETWKNLANYEQQRLGRFLDGAVSSRFKIQT